MVAIDFIHPTNATFFGSLSQLSFQLVAFGFLPTK
jgi:hypothetical protein